MGSSVAMVTSNWPRGYRYTETLREDRFLKPNRTFWPSDHESKRQLFIVDSLSRHNCENHLKGPAKSITFLLSSMPTSGQCYCISTHNSFYKAQVAYSPTGSKQLIHSFSTLGTFSLGDPRRNGINHKHMNINYSDTYTHFKLLLKNLFPALIRVNESQMDEADEKLSIDGARSHAGQDNTWARLTSTPVFIGSHQCSWFILLLFV